MLISPCKYLDILTGWTSSNQRGWHITKLVSSNAYSALAMHDEGSWPSVLWALKYKLQVCFGSVESEFSPLVKLVLVYIVLGNSENSVVLVENTHTVRDLAIIR